MESMSGMPIVMGTRKISGWEFRSILRDGRNNLNGNPAGALSRPFYSSFLANLHMLPPRRERLEGDEKYPMPGDPA
jgi:hypothetical protein